MKTVTVKLACPKCGKKLILEAARYSDGDLLFIAYCPKDDYSTGPDKSAAKIVERIFAAYGKTIPL
jgi:hypothetical protein